MGNTTATIISETFESFYSPLSTSKHRHPLSFLWSPLMICLLLAIIVRVWLIVHTNGVIAGALPTQPSVTVANPHILIFGLPAEFWLGL